MASLPDPPALRPRRRRNSPERGRRPAARARAARGSVTAFLAALLWALPGGAPDIAATAAPVAVELPATADTSPGPPAHERRGHRGPGEGSAVAPFVPEWSWPLQPAPEVLRPFEQPAQRWKRGHRGVDLSAGAGEPVQVVSPADGVVSFAGTVVDRGVLSIDHGNGLISSFEPVSTDLSRGEHVDRGQVVATLDASRAGRPADGPVRKHCGEPCLHWGVREDGEYVDPLSFVTDRRPSVLLPLGDRPRDG